MCDNLESYAKSIFAPYSAGLFLTFRFRIELETVEGVSITIAPFCLEGRRDPFCPAHGPLFVDLGDGKKEEEEKHRLVFTLQIYSLTSDN